MFVLSSTLLSKQDDLLWYEGVLLVHSMLYSSTGDKD